MPWLSIDVVRTVFRRVFSELVAIDQDPVDAARLAQFMYPPTQQAADWAPRKAE
jgi:hypothetical protein